MTNYTEPFCERQKVQRHIPGANRVQTYTRWVCLHFFLRKLLMFCPPRLSVVFLRLVRLGSFSANVTPIPKGPPPSRVANYWPISITSVLFKVFKRLHGVGSSRQLCGTQWCASNHPVYLSERSVYMWCVFVHVPYTAKWIGELALIRYRIVQIEFSTAFDWVNHQGIVYMLCYVGIGASVLSIFWYSFIKSITVCYGGRLSE